MSLPPTTSLRPRWLWIPATLLVVALAAWSFRHWQHNRDLSALPAALPPLPAASTLPPELAARLTTAADQVRHGPARLAAFTELASLLHANGHLPEAARCYQALLPIDSANPRWPHRLALIYASFGELSSAVPLWENIFSAGYTPARLRLGDALLKLGRPTEAARAYSAVLQSDPTNPHALTGLARIDLASGRLPEARTRLEQAAARSNLAIGADLLATVCEQLGDTTRATDLRSRAKSAGAYYDPPDPWADEILADCYDPYRLAVAAGTAAHTGDAALARRLVDRALQLAPTDGTLLLQAALLALRAGDLAAAQSLLERAVATAPRNPDVWAQLVELHTTRGDFTAAARALQSGLTHCPQSPGLRLEFARRLAAAGHTDQAIAQFRESFRLRPEEADPLIEIARLELQREHLEPALAALHQALDVAPEHPVALTTLALHALATGDESSARAWWRRCADQVRIPRDQLAGLRAQFIARFGHPPD